VFLHVRVAVEMILSWTIALYTHDCFLVFGHFILCLSLVGFPTASREIINYGYLVSTLENLSCR